MIVDIRDWIDVRDRLGLRLVRMDYWPEGEMPILKESASHRTRCDAPSDTNRNHYSRGHRP
jgi:hypothetical protein